MPKLTIEQPHKMPADETKKSLDGLATDLAEKYGLTSRWISETEAKVERTGASGTIKIEPQRVVVSLDLSFALSPLKGTIESRIRDELRKIFSVTTQG